MSMNNSNVIYYCAMWYSVSALDCFKNYFSLIISNIQPMAIPEFLLRWNSADSATTQPWTDPYFMPSMPKQRKPLKKKKVFGKSGWGSSHWEEHLKLGISQYWKIFDDKGKCLDFEVHLFDRHKFKVNIKVCTVVGVRNQVICPVTGVCSSQ